MSQRPIDSNANDRAVTCATFRDFIERRSLEEEHPADCRTIEMHCATCADCAAIEAADAKLRAVARELEPEPGELAEVRRAVLRQARLDTPSPVAQHWNWLSWRLPAAAAAGLAMLAVAFLAGRRAASTEVPRNPLVRELGRMALVSYGSHDPLESPFTYSNVRIEAATGGRLRLDFDVSTHLALERPANDSLVAEVVAQTLLTGAAPVGGRLEAVAAADRLLDPRVRKALLQALTEDPSSVVRLKAFAELARRRGDPAVEKAALDLLGRETSVQIRLAAIDYLTGNGVDRGALQRALQATDPATRGPLIVRASQYLQTN
ncbi:MAG: hypothetical protein ABI609_05495 [Acidobacteriota bacterium]